MKPQILSVVFGLLVTIVNARAAIVTETYTFTIDPPELGNIDDYQEPPKVFLQTISTSQILYITKVEVRLKLAGRPANTGSGFASEMFVSLNKDFDQTAVLLNRVGITEDNPIGFFYDGWDVTFADDAPTDIHEADTVDGSGILTGTYQPDGRTSPTDTLRPQMLTEFNNLRGNGDWRLAVGDLEMGGVMRLESWELILTGEAAPEIQVEQPLTTILVDDVGTVAYGNVSLGSSSGAKTFTIKNIGTVSLTGIAVTKDGMHSSDFTLNTNSTSTTVTPGNSTTFSVNFAPSAAGPREAALHIGSNDADENPFEIALSGYGLTVAEAWRLQYFSTTENTGDAADNANPDGDGMVNLLERAFGTNPTVNQSNVVSVTGQVITPGSPTTLLTTTQYGVDFQVLYSRRKDYLAAGLTYTVQFSADLSTWVNSTTTPTVVADDGVLQAVTVPYRLFIDGRKARFFRIAVTQE